MVSDLPMPGGFEDFWERTASNKPSKYGCSAAASSSAFPIERPVSQPCSLNGIKLKSPPFILQSTVQTITRFFEISSSSSVNNREPQAAHAFSQSTRVSPFVCLSPRFPGEHVHSCRYFFFLMLNLFTQSR
eukprot:GHVN01020031.1.p2 GENE.GHVN01020031.1~~GHVN01020031.1.p2  ORF type:complete len:131 (-),score=14.02 GHVN01020031.1:444-836(-)